MASKLTKAQKRRLREKQLKNSIRKKELQDAKGISRKKVKNTLNPHIFRTLKIISIILIPVFYFLDSRFLIFCIIFTIVVGFFAKKTERYMNKSFIKSNHIKIPKFDSILAVVVLVITCAGTLLQLNSSKHRSEDNWWMDVKMQLSNTGSCLTGERRLINTHTMGFGTGDIPDDMPEKGDKPSNVSLDDLPIEAVFSMMISSVNSVLIFIVPLSGLLSLWVFKKRKEKFTKEMNEFIPDTYHELSDEEVLTIFTWGYEMDSEDKALFIEDYNKAKERSGLIDLTSANTVIPEETSIDEDGNIIILNEKNSMYEKIETPIDPNDKAKLYAFKVKNRYNKKK